MKDLQKNGWLEQLYNDSPVAIAIYSGEQHIMEYVNPAMCEIWDRLPNQLLGKPVFEALPEVKGQGYEGILDHVYNTGNPYTGHENPAPIMRNGCLETCYFNIHYKIFERKESLSKGIIQTSIEVTNLVNARKRLEDEKDLLKFALGRAHIGTWRFDLISNRLERSSHLDIIFGLKEVQSEIDVVFFNNLVYIDDRPLFEVQFKNALKLGILNFEVRIVLPNTQLRWVQFKGETHYNLAGLPIAISGIVIDITDQKDKIESEKLLAKETAARKESDRQRYLLNSLFLEVPAMIAVLKSPAHTFEFVNPSYQKMFGARQLVGLSVIEALSELKDQGIIELLDKVYATGIPYFGKELNLMVGKGENAPIDAVYVDFLYKATYNEKEEIDGIFVFAYDVTDQVIARKIVEGNHHALEEAQTELSKKNQHLIKVNADLDSFVYTASHDLKAPISNLEGLLSAFLHENKNFTNNELIRMMYQSIERFKKTIVDLTDITKAYRIENEDVANISLTELISEITLDLRQLLEKRPFKIICKLEADIIPYSRKNLRSIVYNLFSNALKYASPKRDPEVVFESHSANGYFVVSVRDNGLGLSEANIKSIFGMFKRVHQHIEGSGIGLYIIKRIIENAGGKIEVKSKEDEGTVFTVYLKQVI